MLEVVGLARRGQPGQLGQGRRLERLEQEQRHPGHDEPGQERAGDRLLGVGGQQLHRQGAGVHQGLGQHRPRQQPAQRHRQLVGVGVGARAGQAPLAPHGDKGGHQRRRAHDDPVGPGRRHAEHGQGGAAQQAGDAVEGEDQAVGAEPPVAGQGAPGQELGEVADQADQQADEEEDLAVEQLVQQGQSDGDAAGDEHDGPHAAHQRRLPHDRATAHARRPPGRQAARQLLLEGQEEPRADEEDGGPQRRQGRVRLRPEGPGGDDEEAVGGEAEDDKADAHRQRALGQLVPRSASGGFAGGGGFGLDGRSAGSGPVGTFGRRSYGLGVATLWFRSYEPMVSGCGSAGNVGSGTGGRASVGWHGPGWVAERSTYRMG